MKPYGMTKRQAADVDVAGCIDNARASRISHLDGSTFRSLRGEKKARNRRIIKRQERNAAKVEIKKMLNDK